MNRVEQSNASRASNRRIAIAGLILLTGLNLVVLAYLAFETFNSLRPTPLIIRGASDVAQAFEAYQSKADGLQKLTAALLGLSSLYALALGFTTYLNAQQYLEVLKSNAERTKAEADRIEGEAKEIIAGANAANARAGEETIRLAAQFPSFDRLSRQVAEMSSELERLLPDTELIDQHYKGMTALDHQKVLFYERIVACFELLNPVAPNAGANELYLRLAKYYRAKYGILSGWQNQGDESSEWRHRCEFYLDKYKRNGDDFVVWNEKAILAYKRQDYDEAEALFSISIRVKPQQQRARYWLSILQHEKGMYVTAEQTLTDSLAERLWEGQENRDRVADIHYNRACALKNGRTREGSGAPNRLGGEKRTRS